MFCPDNELLSVPVALIDAAETDSALHLAYATLIRAGARRLVVDVMADSSASPSGGDQLPTDAADDARAMREIYGRQWVVNNATTADSPPPTESVVASNEPPTRSWTQSTSDSSSDLQTTISSALARHVITAHNCSNLDHLAVVLMESLSEVFRMAMDPHFHQYTIDLVLNGGTV